MIPTLIVSGVLAALALAWLGYNVHLNRKQARDGSAALSALWEDTQRTMEWHQKQRAWIRSLKENPNDKDPR